MNPSVNSSPRRAIGFFVISLVFAASAHAGPPLICHSIAIGQAQSLPWTSPNSNLSGTETYDVKNLVGDTLAILDSTAPVLVRMETLRQWLGKDANNPANGVDGYAWVKKALELRSPDPQMEFAAALITLSGPKEEHREHVMRATAGAEKDAVLAQNLASRFVGNSSPTIAEMFAKSTAQDR